MTLSFLIKIGTSSGVIPRPILRLGADGTWGRPWETQCRTCSSKLFTRKSSGCLVGLVTKSWNRREILVGRPKSLKVTTRST